jgi:membrane-bound metal-dependent hydrolase YbcI (DUF457 family)
MAVGGNALWLAGIFGKVDQSLLILIPVALFASILPDIDATAAKIHFIGGGFLGIFRGVFNGKYFHHRGIMHSIFVSLIFFAAAWIFFKDSLPALPYIFGLSYFSHLLIDGFNTKVGYFYPFSLRRFALLPKPLLFRVKSAPDFMLMFAGILGLILFFFIFSHQLIPQTSMQFPY